MTRTQPNRLPDLTRFQLLGKINRDIELRKMVADSEPVEDQEVNLPEGASLAPKMASEEELREAQYERMEANLKPIEELEGTERTEGDSE